MVDLYKDFAYARLTAAVAPGATTLTVDSSSRFPSNATLAKGEFWITLDSPTQEVVRLISVSGTTLTISATTLAHASGVFVKASVTSAMLRRVRRAFEPVLSLPTVDVELYQDGDSVLVTSTLTPYILYGGSWWPIQSGYLRYVDLGNVVSTGVASMTVGGKVLRGIAGGQAGGATVVAGALVIRNLRGTPAGVGAASGSLTVTGGPAPGTYASTYSSTY